MAGMRSCQMSSKSAKSGSNPSEAGTCSNVEVSSIMNRRAVDVSSCIDMTADSLVEDTRVCVGLAEIVDFAWGTQSPIMS